MPSYQAPVRDTQFIINEVLGIERYANLPGFENASADMIEAILTEGSKFVEGVLFPLNQVGDLQGCTRHADGSVTTPDGFKEAYTNIALPVGALCRHRKNLAGRGCRISFRWRLRNIWRARTWPLPCIPA